MAVEPKLSDQEIASLIGYGRTRATVNTTWMF